MSILHTAGEVLSYVGIGYFAFGIVRLIQLIDEARRCLKQWREAPWDRGVADRALVADHAVTADFA